MATLSGTTSSSSSSSSSLSSTTTSVSHHTDVAECWICRDSESTQDNPILHGVCRCIGSIGHVHQHCVDQWVFAQKHECCPSCLTAYRIDSATYPAGVIFPKTPKEELRCVVKYLILPLMWSAMRLALSAGINFLLQCIITPLIIGFSFHGDVASLAGVLRMEEGATFIFPQLRWTEWLCWLTYGLICIFAVHGTIAGWRQWQDFFRDHPNIPAGGGGGGGAAMDAAAGAAGGGGGGAQLEFTPVESIFAMLEHNYATYHLSLKSASRCALNLGVSIPVSLIARTTTGKLVALVAFAVICIAWRLFFPAKTLKDPRRRFDEVGERKGEATPRDVRLWFITYVVEFLCFSVTLPLVGGIVLHYAVSPYFATFTRESFMESFDELHLVLYWALGTGCSFVLLHVESSVIVALFAPGVDLFYVRSVDFNFDTEGIYWRCVLTQVFVADPLRVVLEFVRLIFIDGLVLLFFVSAPLWCGFHLREMIWHDVSEGRISFPLPVGFPAYRPGGLTGNATIEDWMQLQQIEAINASFVKGGVLALTNATAALATAAGSAAMVGSSVAYLVKYADAALASVDDNTSYSYLPHFSFLSQEWLLGMSAAGHLCSVSALATRPWGPDETSHLRLVHDHIHNLLPDDPMAAQAHLQKSLDDQRRLLAQKFSDGLIPANLIHYDDAVGCVALSHRYGLSFLAINIWGEAFDFLSWIPASFYYVTIKHPAYGTWFIDGFNLVAIFTTLACFAFTPIQRAQLKVLRPFVGVLARLFQMEEFLLDPEREEILDHFLHGVDMGEELLMPPMTPAMVFTRRERVVPPEKIPAHLSLRLAGLSILFLIGSTALVWAIPILLMNAALCVVPYTVPILVATSCVLFYAISPQHFWENVFVACAMLVLLFAWPAVEGTLKARNMLVSVVGSRGSIVRWTMEYRFRIRRQVGLMLNETETEEWTTDEDW